ncbi:helix-hairpin-helix domain-containing protein [Porticoccaceae bacterium LTM1]|nr:helix-hairpin-helix domain-containing protein [Porticoccaceae bacterium LTM1]
MNPTKVDRSKTTKLTDLPNIGKAGASDLQLLGITSPQDLVGRDPYQMYEELCNTTGRKHDPCVIDVLISITRFMDGEDAKPWWAYTEERKHALDTK